MRKNTALFLAITGLLAWNTASAANIRIDAPKIRLELAPGEAFSGEIGAENNSGEETRVRMYLEDWVYAKGGAGEKIFGPAGTAPFSASGWIKFAPADGVIPSFGRVVTRYTVTVPKDAKGTYYSVLFFESAVGAARNEEGVNILVSARLGALFYIEVKGTVERRGEIRSVEVRAPEGNRPLEILATFQNTGNVDITVEGNFLVMDAEGRVQARGNLNPVYTFPGETESGRTQWVGRLPTGRYDTVITFDLGKGESIVKEEPLVIP